MAREDGVPSLGAVDPGETPPVTTDRNRAIATARAIATNLGPLPSQEQVINLARMFLREIGLGEK